ncbi:MAG: hypothetical protein WCV62_03880 [Candidatus Peribacteraceae bacterium]|jgi:hypothetical protein
MTLGGRYAGSASAVPPLPASSFVRCVQDVRDADWNTYRSAEYSFAFRYPKTYAVREEGKTTVLEALVPEENGVRNQIVFTTLRSTLKKEQVPEMRLAGWKVQDRQAYALTTPYFTNDDLRSLSETYLFVRDFPTQGLNGTYTIVRATLTLSTTDPDLVAAKAAKIKDLESIFTEPEQILSTFRFLQRTELPGRDGGR